jgi:predicted Zn-dependent protease
MLNQDAIILFQIAEGNTPSDAANKFVTDSKASVVSSDGTTVNGLSAHKVISDISSDQGQLRVLSFFIKKGNNIFVFHGFTAQASFGQHQQTFQNTMIGFRNLTDQSKINVKPDKVVVKKVSTATTLEQALKSFGVADDKLNETALLNGMELSNSIAANTFIKYIERAK